MISRFHYITQDIPGYSHTELAEIACKNGVQWVQLRLKEVNYDLWLKTASETLEICKKYNARLIINDNVEVALKINADGVHLGAGDMSPEKARKILGYGPIIGATANTMDDIERLSQLEIDYIGLGPFRFTSTKKNLSPVLGMEGLKKISTSLKHNVPLVAIGGIKPEDVEEILSTGVHGIAVSSAINMAEDKGKVIKAFLDKLNIKN
ncbi:MAG: thiamine phosphate synthase [Bacteroidetes bacterium]|nr:thiamine phosphate synthase [Bacteroidota bacterium]HET6243862.1 thiamine phosphate synthase [Bacteroidia bacterium]